VAFIGIGSVAAGTTPVPPPVGAVAGASDTAPGSGAGRSAAPPVEDAGRSAAPPVRDPTTAASLGARTTDEGFEVPAAAHPATPYRAVPPPLSGLTGYQWPLPKARLTLPFGPTPWGSRIVEGVRFHDGVDLATFCGDRIVAAHGGVVLAAGRHFDDVVGWLGDLAPYYARLDAKKLWATLPIVVVIDDGNGYRSIYAHFGKVVVKKGASVTAGSLLGYEGATGRASGCHLHYSLFSLLESGSYAIDPAVVKRMKLPPAEIARVDPLLVLPQRHKPTSSAGPSASPAP